MAYSEQIQVQCPYCGYINNPITIDDTAKKSRHIRTCMACNDDYVVTVRYERIVTIYKLEEAK